MISDITYVLEFTHDPTTTAVVIGKWIDNFITHFIWHFLDVAKHSNNTRQLYKDMWPIPGTTADYMLV